MPEQDFTRKNIAQKIRQRALETPNKAALKLPRKNLFSARYTYDTLSFAKFERDSDAMACGLKERGLKKGDRTLVFLKPGRDFALTTFALFKLGAVPVFIDPGMGKDNLLNAIKEVSPQALVGLPIVHLMAFFYPKVFAQIALKFCSGGLPLPKTHRLKDVLKLGQHQLGENKFELADMSGNQTGAILFTSGGTGRPKGVIYSHSIFIHQTEALQEMFSLTANDVDLPAFPLFSFFTMAMGMTSVPPDMNPSKPAKCDPKKLIQNIKDVQASFVAGSPAIWERVADYALANDIVLESVRCLVMFGAPVPLTLHQKLMQILPNGQTYTPYGATESLPVSLASANDILRDQVREKMLSGIGTFIGRPAPQTQIAIIPTSNRVIENIEQTHFLPVGEVGEIIVKSPTTTLSYFKKEQATAESKIRDGQQIWHRMGDLGHIDKDGQLWFCGRKAHHLTIIAGQTPRPLYSICTETFFNQIPGVRRSALIGLDETTDPTVPTRAGIVLEMNKKMSKKIPPAQLIEHINNIQKERPLTSPVCEVYLAETFPVDVRHNIKIDRPKLGLLARTGKLERIYERQQQ